MRQYWEGKKVKLAVLFSGGKDSTYALHLSKKEGHDIACLLSMIPGNPESHMFHTPNIELSAMQASAIGLPYERFETRGEKEVEVEDLKSAIAAVKGKYGIDGIVSGAIASNYQKGRIDRICLELGLVNRAPLWGAAAGEYLRRFLSDGFKTIFTAVSADGLGPEWLGRELDDASLSELEKLGEKYRLNVSLEGGEAETFVIDGPIFRKSIKVLESEKLWQGGSGILKIRKAELVASKKAF